MGKSIIIIASLFGAAGVMLGAFGAHAFEDILRESGRTDTFNTAVEYHFYHTLAALMAPFILHEQQYVVKARIAAFFFLLGVVLFSGSLYFLVFTEESYLAYITPFGGVSFIIGWLLLSYAAYKSKFKGDRKI